MNIDLNDPRVKMAIFIYRTQIKKAMEVPQRVEDAVLPIYWTLKSTKKPEQTGSGVIVRIKDEYFVFSASHVFDDIGQYSLLIGAGDGSPLTPLSGDRFSSKRGASGTHKDDPIDASVFHIQSGITDKIKDISLSLEDLDFSQPDEEKSIHMAAGFMSKKSKTIGKIATGKRECFPSIECDEHSYSLLSIDRKIHIALSYEDKILIDGNWQTSPSPKGMSGGAIIKVHGINMAPPFYGNPEAKQLLTAITIEQRREKGGRPGVLIGTRIDIYLSLINKYLPGLLDIEMGTDNVI